MLRVTAIFSDINETEGWSETYYLSRMASIAAFTGNPVNQIGSPLNLFLTQRRAILAGGEVPKKGAYLVKIRMSIPSSFRTSFAFNVPSGSQRGQYKLQGEDNVDSVEFWTRLLVDLQAGGTGTHGRLFLGGVPESLLQAPDTYVESPLYTRQLNNFFGVLDNFGWQIRRRTQQNDVGTPPVGITLLSVQADNRTAFITPHNIAAGGGNPPPTGQLIIRSRTPSEWNGIHRYRLDLPNTRLIVGPARQNLADWPGVVQTGTVQLFTADFEDVTADNPLRFVERKIGDPFVVRRGRRKRSQG